MSSDTSAVVAGIVRDKYKLVLTIEYVDKAQLDEVGLLSGVLAGYKELCHREEVEPVSFFLTEFEGEYGELLDLESEDPEDNH